MDKYKYTIDDNTFAIKIYDTENETDPDVPGIYQPHHPDTSHTPWESREAAEEWVKEFIQLLLNPVLPPITGKLLNT